MSPAVGRVGTARVSLDVTTQASAGGRIPAGASLLPAPGVQVEGIEAVYALMAKSNAIQADAQKTSLRCHHAEKKKAMEELRKQIDEQIKAEKEGDSPLEVLGKVGAVVGAACAIVASWGTATVAVVAVAIALSVAGSVVSKTKCFDDAFGKGASTWIGLGMQVAAVACSLGASLGSSANAASEAANTAKTAGSVASSASAVMSGAERVRQANVAKRADDAMIGAKEAQNVMRRQQRAIEDCIQSLSELKDERARGTKLASETTQSIVETTMIAITGARA